MLRHVWFVSSDGFWPSAVCFAPGRLFHLPLGDRRYLLLSRRTSSVRFVGHRDAAKIQYLCTLVRGEALHQFDILSADLESSTPLTLEAIFWYWVRTFSCQCAVKAKSHNTPRNEEAARIKRKMLHGSFD